MGCCNIKRARQAKGYSQESFAEALGTTQASVSRWELGTSEPRPAMRQKIASLLDVSVAYLMGEDADPEDVSPTVKPQDTVSESVALVASTWTFSLSPYSDALNDAAVNAEKMSDYQLELVSDQLRKALDVVEDVRERRAQSGGSGQAAI